MLEQRGKNAGFLLWNMSREISATKNRAKAARVGAGSDPGLLEMVVGLEECAAEADQLWKELLSVGASERPGLVEGDKGGVVVIHNEGPNQELAATFEELWGKSSCCSKSRALFSDFERYAGD